MAIQAIPIAPEEQINWLERKGDDFPYYRGQPVNISTVGWLIVLAATALAFALLMPLQRAFPTGVGVFVSAIVFVSLPLIALAIVARTGWTAIFRRLRPSDFLWMVAFLILNYIVTIAVGLLVVNLFGAQANPAGSIIGEASTLDRVFFFLKAAIQLFGEELFTILPFLAILYWLTRSGTSRTFAVVIAAVVVSFIFAAIHLPTYQWNIPQAFIGLVPIRIVLLLPYLMTKNIWVSTGTHIMNDYLTFGLPLLLADQVA